MKTKITNRFFTAVIIALMLSLILAVSSLAALSGGYDGTIKGLESGKTYEAKEATLNTDGTGAQYGEAFDLDSSSNKDLAGLYVVREKGAADWSDLIYVYGSHAERADLTEKVVGGTYNGYWQSKNAQAGFFPGFFSGTGVRTPNGNIGKLYISTWGNHANKADVENYNNASPDQKAAKFAILQTALKSQLFKYTLTTKEIIPISLVKSYSFSFSAIESSLSYSNLDMQFTVHVMDDKGVVTNHSIILTKTSFAQGVSQSFTCDFASPAKWTPALPTDGYFVAFTFAPFYGFNNEANFKYSRSANVRATFYPGTYSISEPVIPLPDGPEGITVKRTKVSGLDLTKSYMIAPFDINGVIAGENNANVKSITGVAEINLADLYTDPVGLYGIYYAENGAQASKPAIVYVYGSHSARADLGEKVPEGQSLAGYWMAKTHVEGFVTGYFTGLATRAQHSAIKLGEVTDWNTNIDKTVVAAYNAETDTTAKAQKFAEIAATLKTKTFKYGFTTEEIIPISLVNNYTFTVKAAPGTFAFQYEGLVMRFDAHVMGDDGVVTVYSYDAAPYTILSGASRNNVVTVDFTKADGWVNKLPENGYLVGYEIHPYHGINDATKFTYKMNTHTRVILTLGAYSIDEPVLELGDAPTGITVETTFVKGLDSTKSYQIVPYNINGMNKGENDENVKNVSGVDKIDLTTLYTSPVGLYGICYTDGGEQDSNYTLIHLYGSHAAREDLGEKVETQGDTYGFWKAKTLIDGFEPGYFTGLATRAPIKDTKLGKVTDWHTNVDKSVVAAYNSETDATKKAEKFAEISATLKTKTFKYALTSEEIVEISLVQSYSFDVLPAPGTFAFRYEGLVMKYDAYVMDKDGNLTIHSFFDEPYTIYSGVSNTNTVNVDFTDASKWTPALPTDGYFVGFEIHPYYGFDDASKARVESTTTQTRVILTPGAYVVNKPPKIAVPDLDGVTVLETVVSGLDASKTYNVAPYNFGGILAGTENENVKEIIGETTVDIAELYDTLEGLYAIYTPEDDFYEASKPVFIFVYADYETRQKLGIANGQAIKDGDKITKAPGVFEHTNTQLGFDGAYNSTEFRFYGMYQYSQAFPQALYTEFYTAQKEGIGDKEAIFEEIKATLQNQYYSYVYEQSEIVPVSDLRSYTFSLVLRDSGRSYSNNVVKYVAYVVNEDGEVDSYSTYFDYELKYYANATDSPRFTVDFVNGDWDKTFPAEGYMVGFEVYPYYGFENADDLSITSPIVEADKNDGWRLIYRFYYGEDNYAIKKDGIKPNIASFPVIAGGYGEISGLNPTFIYEYQYSADGESYTDWADVEGSGVTAFKVTDGGFYRVRVKGTYDYHESEYAEVEVGSYTEAEDLLKSEVVKMHLPNDFVNVQAEYVMDVSVKSWVSSLALENLKTIAPDSKITFDGKDYKIVVKTSKIKLDPKVHYYNLAVSLDGESRHNTLHDKLKTLAGEGYLTDVYFESSTALPFTEAQVMIAVDSYFNSFPVEVRSYYERTKKLRKVVEVSVYRGWVSFNAFSDTYVLIVK